MRKPDQRIIQTWSEREKRIVDYYFEKKVSEFVEEDFAALDRKINLWQGFLGVKDILLEHHIHELMEYIQEYFMDFSIMEMDLAIKLAVAKELHIEDNQHYNNFGALYLSKVFVAYREYRGRTIVRYFKHLDALVNEDKPKPNTEQQRILMNYTGSISLFTLFKNNKNIIDLGNVTFNYLDELGMIPFSSERRLALKKLSTENYISNLKKKSEKGESSMKDLIEAMVNNKKTEEEMLQYEYKKYALNVFFGELVEMELELKELLDQKLKGLEIVTENNP